MKTLFLDSAQIDTLLQGIDGALPKSVLTIGNFDGVHLGHQAMLQQLQTTASENGLSTMVMIFEPQPREYFAMLKGNPESAPPRLTNQDEKLTLLKTFGVDIVVVATFNDAFRSLSAAEFADLLVNKLNVSALVLGDDFKFGHDRTGDSEFLRQYGLPVTNLHTVTDNHVLQNEASVADDRISSTRIRELLQSGDIETANRLLGHDYTITGNVLTGDAIGRTLDFPTANVALNRVHPALHGIYGVDVVILDEAGNVISDAFETIAEAKTDSTVKKGIVGLRPHSLFGTANVGTRPSVDKPREWRLEVFFPQFTGDLYGKTLNVRFLHYLHGERQYDGLEALKRGINQDVQDLLAWRQVASD